jgi:predicted NACHT family NTPase
MKLKKGICYRCQKDKQLVSYPRESFKVCVQCRDNMFDEERERESKLRYKLQDESVLSDPKFVLYQNPSNDIERAINLSYEVDKDAPFSKRLDFVIEKML